MTQPLKRHAARLCWFAVCFIFAATGLSFSSEAQTSAAKRAAPSGKSRATVKSAANAAWVPNPAVAAKDAYLIVDATSGRELMSDRPDELRHPASLAKLMTLYLTFSALDAGHLSFDSALPVSTHALRAPPTKLGMSGRTITVRDAAMGLITRSANDAAIVLAEALGGTEESFARQMTHKARQLGMTSTVFRNASGLPNREQVTTARDMAKLAQALLRDFPHYYPVFSVQSYSYRGRTLDNHNRMLGSYAGADGLKTGYTAASGFNLVMSAVRGDRRLIGVVMGGNTAFQRDRAMAELMDRGFSSAETMRLAAWTWPHLPAKARYDAAHFVPGITTPRLTSAPQIAKAEAVPASAVVPRTAATSTTVATLVDAAQPSPAVGSWVIQVGSFSDSRAAELALQRASSALPEAIRLHTALTIDEVDMAHKTFHRARFMNLSQEDAIEGCRRLEQRKIYCAALQVTAWNTPGAR
jgi:D-alanyl-D-alanine carboxypeptidase